MINWRFYVIYFFSMQLCWMCSSVGRASDSRPESRQFKSGHVQEHMWDDVLLQHKVVVRDSIVASIPACHAGDRGSIPRRGDAYVERNPPEMSIFWCLSIHVPVNRHCTLSLKMLLGNVRGHQVNVTPTSSPTPSSLAEHNPWCY